MIIHSKNHVTGVDEKSIQPNAIDIRCSKLLEIQASEFTRILISEDKKQFFPTRDIHAEITTGFDAPRACWRLDPLSSYQFETDHIATIPEGMAGWLIIRSTLSRNGIIMSSGLYDAGYKGIIGGTIHNLTAGAIMLEQDCRIGQFIMSDSETSHLYDGHYNKTEGRSIS